MWSADLSLGGAPISAWGGVPELDWVCVGIISMIFCVEIVELGLCGVIYCVDLGLCGFDMVVGVGVMVVIVWGGGGCCGGDCVGDGCEKK